MGLIRKMNSILLMKSFVTLNLKNDIEMYVQRFRENAEIMHMRVVLWMGSEAEDIALVFTSNCQNLHLSVSYNKRI